MTKLRVRFFEDGKWMDTPRDPILFVKEDEVHEVSPRLAKIVVEVGKGELVLEDPEDVSGEDEGVEPKSEKSGVTKKSEKKKAKGKKKGAKTRRSGSSVLD